MGAAVAKREELLASKVLPVKPQRVIGGGRAAGGGTETGAGKVTPIRNAITSGSVDETRT